MTRTRGEPPGGSKRLSPQAIAAAAEILLEARQSGRMLSGLPAACRPTNMEDAYAIQDRLFREMGAESAGWFVGCSNPAIQKQLGLAGPYRARLDAATVRRSPATLDPGRFPTITLELEFAFRLARDLPPRRTAYGEAEVADAVAAVHPAIEVVTSHFETWTEQPIWSLIADNGTDGALIYDPEPADWRSLDLAGVQVELSVNGDPVRRGSGAAVLGGPLRAMTWLANDCRAAGIGLRAGQLHNTGSCTAMYVAEPGDLAEARFAGLGEVRIRF